MRPDAAAYGCSFQNGPRRKPRCPPAERRRDPHDQAWPTRETPGLSLGAGPRSRQRGNGGPDQRAHTGCTTASPAGSSTPDPGPWPPSGWSSGSSGRRADGGPARRAATSPAPPHLDVRTSVTWAEAGAAGGRSPRPSGAGPSPSSSLRRQRASARGPPGRLRRGGTLLATPAHRPGHRALRPPGPGTSYVHARGIPAAQQ